ncbi:Gir2p KNAG_0A05110 [Huiozyma naganishii CBS 8797]|uniref:RWD domain-containing protein n=1 Tax=Huiozyma naganishii (strain ATCC MYA-139 / BCRC 22969 / CBS 8797 / KCTC 17520 / NBRC 10181 / NCYC 3082 / Yp74L-3) TaxID=1071383 RepID=J7RF39_HUIN7|nr:hypothetical protein KNAG_0A05110 [Kazachstania naganishii CBS 8797]CCK68178.1 hypothetical protein KNAG_0A05110 [Kazachstania naganishii CBS 8797]
MDYKEEQLQELEVLQSIYPDELHVVSDGYPGVKFEVGVPLELDADPLAKSLSKRHVVLIGFVFPEMYPDVPPLLSIEPQEFSLHGENSDDDDDDDDSEEEQEYDEHGNKMISKLEVLPDTISFDEYVPELQKKTEQQIEDDMLVGMQMCFALISSIKENCESWFLQKLTSLEELHEQQLAEKERQEQIKFTGTKVTKESFNEWRDSFRKEWKLDERDSNRRIAAHHGKMTGRQMFEQGVVGNADDVEDVAEALQDL